MLLFLLFRGLHVGEISKLGWLIRLARQDIWTDSLGIRNSSPLAVPPYLIPLSRSLFRYLVPIFSTEGDSSRQVFFLTVFNPVPKVSVFYLSTPGWFQVLISDLLYCLCSVFMGMSTILYFIFFELSQTKPVLSGLYPVDWLTQIYSDSEKFLLTGPSKEFILTNPSRLTHFHQFTYRQEQINFLKLRVLSFQSTRRWINSRKPVVQLLFTLFRTLHVVWYNLYVIQLHKISTGSSPVT
jgi:hypothetical protein